MKAKANKPIISRFDLEIELESERKKCKLLTDILFREVPVQNANYIKLVLDKFEEICRTSGIQKYEIRKLKERLNENTSK